MKKLLVLIMTGIITLGVLAPWANAEIITRTDTTEVKSYQGLNPSPYGGNDWHDVLGDNNNFQTYEATYNTVSQVFTIKTNWDGPNYNTLGATTADLFLNFTDLGWVVAVGLGDGRKNNVYVNFTDEGYQPISHFTSKTWNSNYFPGTGNWYAGQYNQTSPADVPVQAQGTAAGTKDGLVTWTSTPSTGDPRFVAIDLKMLNEYLFSLNGDGLDPSGGFSFLWGTGTCGNDTFADVIPPTGVVPVPGSLLLLGTGLVGLLAAYPLRNRRS